MKRYEIVSVKKVSSFICDCCKVETDDPIEMQEFLHFENNCGFNSIWGDGSRVELDLCQECTKKLLGDYIRVYTN